MIFWRAKELLEGGSELFRAEAEPMSKRVRRLLIGSVFAGVVTLFALLGLTLLTAGVTILLSDRIGWGASLVCVGVAYMRRSGVCAARCADVYCVNRVGG